MGTLKSDIQQDILFHMKQYQNLVDLHGEDELNIIHLQDSTRWIQLIIRSGFNFCTFDKVKLLEHLEVYQVILSPTSRILLIICTTVKKVVATLFMDQDCIRPIVIDSSFINHLIECNIHTLDSNGWKWCNTTQLYPNSPISINWITHPVTQLQLLMLFGNDVSDFNLTTPIQFHLYYFECDYFAQLGAPSSLLVQPGDIKVLAKSSSSSLPPPSSPPASSMSSLPIRKRPRNDVVIEHDDGASEPNHALKRPMLRKSVIKTPSTTTTSPTPVRTHKSGRRIVQYLPGSVEFEKAAAMLRNCQAAHNKGRMILSGSTTVYATDNFKCKKEKVDKETKTTSHVSLLPSLPPPPPPSPHPMSPIPPPPPPTPLIEETTVIDCGAVLKPTLNPVDITTTPTPTPMPMPYDPLSISSLPILPPEDPYGSVDIVDDALDNAYPPIPSIDWSALSFDDNAMAAAAVVDESDLFIDAGVAPIAPPVLMPAMVSVL